MSEIQKIKIIEFTDPVCSWCWALEPILRKLETRYKDHLELTFVMGGLVRDISDFYSSSISSERNPEHTNDVINSHWKEASAKHHMPVVAKGFHLFSKEYPSAYPLNIAYKAAQMENQQLADKFLRRLREASIVEAKLTNRQEVLIELASEVGLDVSQFILHLKDGSAEKAFKEDLATTQRYGVHGFPTSLIQYGNKEVLLRGYQSYESFKAVIDSLSGGKIIEAISPVSKENILQFIKTYKRVAPEEIRMAFDIQVSEVSAYMKTLVQEKIVRSILAGNGEFIELIGNPVVCDPETGVCQI
ncbi:DsbA family protein [uncultured Sphaerochaeta sp.]|uniref:DsbA family oxidoreductase n=1 Tax=uncultured Sphaerochaeta sp. TaxID=886478 RepID=UPI002A0A7FD9|nr:DsbA family protein [uncultured Sphaerochaeta sp.]